jgi:hypothetical protein
VRCTPFAMALRISAQDQPIYTKIKPRCVRTRRPKFLYKQA